MNRTVACFLLLLSILACNDRYRKKAEATHEGRNEVYGHPRTILTQENIDLFKAKSGGDGAHLFLLAEKQADLFCQRETPLFEDANNSYREIGDALPVLGLMYQLKGDYKFAVCAEKWIKALLATESWEGSQNLGRSSWVMGLAFTYDWMYDILEPGLKRRLINRLVKEAKIIMSTASRTRALSNHLLIETSAIGMVGLVLDTGDSVRDEFLQQADAWAQYIIGHAPTDGSWGEGIQYWQYGTGFFMRFLESAHTAGFKDYYANYPWLKKTGYFPIYFSLPDRLTKAINFSDCSSDRYLPAYLLYLPAGKYRNGYFQDFGLKVQAKEPHKLSWLDFIFYDATVEPVDFATLPEFRHFEDHGFVSMRSGWEHGSTVVGFRCGPAPGHRNQADPDRLANVGFGPGHQEPDINNYVIFAQDEWLVIDPGYTKLKETRNYNTLLVNGYGQAGAGRKFLDYMAFESRHPAPRILYAKSHAQFDYLIGDAGNIYVDEAGVEYFRRHLLFLRPDVVVIADDVLAEKRSVIDWLLQVNEIAAVDDLGGRIRVRKNGVEFWIIPVLPEDPDISVHHRKVEARDVHGLPGRKEGILKTIRVRSESQRARFMVIIGIQHIAGLQSPVVAMENNRLNISINGQERRLEYMSGASSKEPFLKMLP